MRIFHITPTNLDSQYPAAIIVAGTHQEAHQLYAIHLETDTPDDDINIFAIGQAAASLDPGVIHMDHICEPTPEKPTRK